MQPIARTPIVLLGPALVRVLRRERPDTIVYLAKSSTTLAGLLRARLLKWVAGDATTIMLALQPRRFPLVTRVLARLLWTDLLVVTSEAERREASRLGARVAVIRPGVDDSRFRPAQPGEKSMLRRKWALPVEARIVLHVGHLKPGRNLQALIPLATLPETAVVVLASSRRTASSAALRDELVRRGIIVLDGYRPDVAELYRLADCYVFPVQSSDWAISLPLSVIEALACGLPVVTSRFGALPELFEGAPGVHVVDHEAGFTDAVMGVLTRGESTCNLVRGWSWDEVAASLLRLREDLRVAHPGDRQPLPALPILSAVLLRGVWKYEEQLRAVLWGKRYGFERRPRPTLRLIRVEPSGQATPHPARPKTIRVGVITNQERPQSSLTACARYYGLEPVEVTTADSLPLLKRATSEAWPMLAMRADHAPPPTPDGLTLLEAFLDRGGTLFVNGVSPSTQRSIEATARALGVEPPVARPLASAAAVIMAGDRSDFTRELAGMRIETPVPAAYLEANGSGRVLAWVESARIRYPAVLELPCKGGRIVCSTGDAELSDRLYQAYGGTESFAVLPPMMLLRQLYGGAAWDHPVRLANITVDDPALRSGVMGLDYRCALDRALEAKFHLTIATVPRELGLATRDVVDLLASHPQSLSACYHGNNHDGYEFYLPNASHRRFRGRPLEQQSRALAQALARGRHFAERTGYQLDQVMVFPHGIGPVEALEQLQRLGFLASCNTFDRFPLGAPAPDAEDLGMRPADLSWAGFPLLWRRSLADPLYPFDLFTGRPLITYAHRGSLGHDLEVLAERAQAINELAAGRVKWRGLAEIARHAYLQREHPQQGWQVWMTANEICLHNSSAGERSCRVRRPNRPPEFELEAHGQWVRGDDIEVIVPGHGTAQVRLARRGFAGPTASECSLQGFNQVE
jgi:glycosyltransferase involved in cell wall biosynthesis